MLGRRSQLAGGLRAALGHCDQVPGPCLEEAAFQLQLKGLVGGGTRGGRQGGCIPTKAQSGFWERG